MQFVAPFVLPLKISSIPVASSRGHLTKRRLAGGAGDAIMTAAGEGKGASFNITKANFLSLPKRSATVAAVGKRWEGRTRWKADGMGGWDGRIDGKSLCPVAFPGRMDGQADDEEGGPG